MIKWKTKGNDGDLIEKIAVRALEMVIELRKNGKAISNYGKDDELKEAAKPLIKYLNENHHPHVTAIVSPTGVEILEGVRSVQNINDFIKD